MTTPIALVLAFLSGSMPTALLMGKLKGIDIRKYGSGNIGATNAMRVLGKGPGAACLLIDILKGWLPAMLFSGGLGGSAWGPEALSLPTWTLIVGLAAVAGHSFSPWVGWSGGKGVATSLGAFLAVAPAAALVCFVVGVALIATTRYVSLASIVGAGLLPISIWYFSDEDARPWTVIAMTSVLAAFIVWRHRANIGRLLSGKESKIFAPQASAETNENGKTTETETQ